MVDPISLAAVFNGDANKAYDYPWAGVLFTPDTVHDEGCLSNPTQVYVSCSASLVNLPGFPTRRVILTAAHCLAADFLNTTTPYPIRVTFERNAYMTFDYTCPRPRFPVGFGQAPYGQIRMFNGIRHYASKNSRFGAGYGVGASPCGE